MAKPSRIYYDNCKDCHSKCEHAGKDREFICTDAHPSCKIAKAATKTNADRIRAMSDDELADLLTIKLAGLAPCNLWMSLPDGEHALLSKGSAVKKTLEWLQQPAKEERNA